MAKRAYKWVWNARIRPESLVALRELAARLGFIVDTPGQYEGTASAPAMLDALAAAYRADPGGTHLTLKVLLQANDLLPAKPSPLTDTEGASS